MITARNTGAASSGEKSRAGDQAGAAQAFVVAIVALVVVVGVVVAGVLPRLRARAELKRTTTELAIRTVSVVHPKLGDPQPEIVLPANVQAYSDSPIYARTSGYLKKWYTDIGARVKAGQLLAEIEAPEVDQQLEQARADLNTAQANYRLAEITVARQQELLKAGVVPKQDADNAEGDFQARRAQVASAEAAVKRLEEIQSFEEIYAPFDGVITARNTDVGHLINSGAGGPATELFHIAAIGRLRVYVNVPQQYSRSALPGLRADLTLPEFPGRRFPGTLVRTAEAIDVASRTLLAEVDADNAGGQLLPGAYAQVHLKIPAGAPTFILPVNTLIFRSEGLQVATVQGDRAALENITLGSDMGNEVEVTSGLSASDQVIVNPPDSIMSGEHVRVVAGEQLGK